MTFSQTIDTYFFKVFCVYMNNFSIAVLIIDNLWVCADVAIVYNIEF